MEMEDKSSFWKELNASPWKGMVAEVGFGMPFTYYFSGTPGASQTLLYAHSPYSRSFQNPNVRAVSLEAVDGMMDHLQGLDTDYQQNKTPRFYLAVSGSHKASNEDGDSHGWIGLRTVIPRDGYDETANTFIHFRLDKTYLGMEEVFKRTAQRKEMDRFTAGYYVSSTIAWLFRALLLGQYESWGHAIKSQNQNITNALHIDVIKDGRISLEEHLALADFGNPLYYHSGWFQRATDCGRTYKRFVSGSFNPPHAVHEEMATNAVCLLNFENVRKESISATDMAHRIRMLDLLGKPVLITREREFFALQAHLLTKMVNGPITLITGTDTFNAIVNPKYLPEGSAKLLKSLKPEEEGDARKKILTDFLKPLYKETGVSFEIYKRPGSELVRNEWTERMHCEVKESNSPELSSTAIRKGDLTGVSEPVAKYIRDNKLYS